MSRAAAARSCSELVSAWSARLGLSCWVLVNSGGRRAGQLIDRWVNGYRDRDSGAAADKQMEPDAAMDGRPAEYDGRAEKRTQTDGWTDESMGDRSAQELDQPLSGSGDRLGGRTGLDDRRCH